jgi:undecaprenyl-diphosphatase
MIFNEILLMENIQKLNLSKQMKLISKPFNTNGFIVMVIILTIYKILSIKDFLLIWLGATLAMLLKLLFRRQRPYHSSNTIINYTNKEHCSITDIYSFPSGHTFSATLFCLILLSKYPTEFVFNIISILVGFSRIFLGVHYPTDIIGGIIFGFLFYKVAF